MRYSRRIVVFDMMVDNLGSPVNHRVPTPIELDYRLIGSPTPIERNSKTLGQSLHLTEGTSTIPLTKGFALVAP